MRYISTSSELLSLSCYFIFGSRCRLCRLWVQTVQQRARKDLFGCRLCRLLGADCAAAGRERFFWVQTVQQRARNELSGCRLCSSGPGMNLFGCRLCRLWVQTGTKTVQRARKDFFGCRLCRQGQRQCRQGQRQCRQGQRQCRQGQRQCSGPGKNFGCRLWTISRSRKSAENE